jgi:E3 ubiquitin-protein ligase RGLG
MGCSSSSSSPLNISKVNVAAFETFEQFSEALYRSGLEEVNLLVAIDFTLSNQSSGTKTFNGKSLHDFPQTTYVPVEGGPPVQHVPSRVLSFDKSNYESSMSILDTLNPYQLVLSIAGQQLERFDQDKVIPTWIFGYNGRPYVQEIHDPDYPDRSCHTMQQVLNAYEHAVRHNSLSGPTLFAPIIQKAIEVCRNGHYHILLIIGDGQIDDMKETKWALKQACSVPLSIIFVGVGDGSDRGHRDPWASMRELDDEPAGEMDNWQSVYMTDLLPRLKKSRHPDVDLAVELFTEIPEQYQWFKKHGRLVQTEFKHVV